MPICEYHMSIHVTIPKICALFQGVSNLVDAAKASGVTKFVLLSSLLTNARAVGQESNPNYKFLNLLGGVLDHKLAGEKYLRASGGDGIRGGGGEGTRGGGGGQRRVGGAKEGGGDRKGAGGGERVYL